MVEEENKEAKFEEGVKVEPIKNDKPEVQLAKEEEIHTEIKQPREKGKLRKFFATKAGRLTTGIIGLVIAIIFLFVVKGAPEPLLFKVAFLTPVRAILLLSIILSLFVTLVYRFATDQVLMKELKKDLAKYQEQMKLHKNDLQKMTEIQKQAMQVNTRYMKQSFKPMFITLIPFFIIFAWLKGIYGTTIVIPLSFWPGHLGWVGVYIIFSLIYSSVLRKILNIV